MYLKTKFVIMDVGRKIMTKCEYETKEEAVSMVEALFDKDYLNEGLVEIHELFTQNVEQYDHKGDLL